MVLRYCGEVINKRTVDVIDELCYPNFLDHSPVPGQASGKQKVKDSFAMFAKAFSYLRVNVEEMVAEKYMVATKLSVTGNQRGELSGPHQRSRKSSSRLSTCSELSVGKMWQSGTRKTR